MNRFEVAVLSAWFVLVVVGCLLRDPVSASLGVVGGAGAGVAALPSVRRVRRAVARRLGEDAPLPHRGVDVGVVGRRVLVHVAAVLAVALVLAVVALAAGRVLWSRTLSPADLEERTGAVGGAIYGTSSNGAAAAFLRPANRSPVPGLFLVGGSSHPGGGLPLVTLSAQIVAGLVGPAG